MSPDHRSPISPRGWLRYWATSPTREPRPLGERPPAEVAWADADDDTLDQFADVGEWEPMHRPLVQVLAVLVSVSLVVAGVGTVLEVVLSAR